jgi:hypothetical protein
MRARPSAALAEMDLPLLPVEEPGFAADPTPLEGEVTWRPYLGIWGLRTLPIEPAAI